MAAKKSILSRAAAAPDLIEAIRQLQEGRRLHLHGTGEGGRPFLASLLAAVMGRTLCVVAHSVRQQEHFHSEACALAPHLPGLRPPIHLPELEALRPKREADAPALPPPDPECLAELLQALHELSHHGEARVIAATEPSLTQKLASADDLRAGAMRLKVGTAFGLERLETELQGRGYERGARVSGRGEFARRGGILDFFPLDADAPVRVEFDGDRIESLRRFDLTSQTSVASLKEAAWSDTALPSEGRPFATLADYLPRDHLVWREPTDTGLPLEVAAAGAEGDPLDLDLEIFDHEFLARPAADPILQEQRHKLLIRHWRDWTAGGQDLAIFCNNEGEERRLREVVTREKLGESPSATARGRPKTAWLQAPLLRGFAWPAAGLVILSDAEIFGRYQTLQMARLQQRMARAETRREAVDFSQFGEGDLVVHAHQGIGRFLGMQKVEVTGVEQEVLTLEYRGGALLYVPVEQAHLVGRYVGIGRASPPLDELGGTRWGKAAAKAQRSVMDYAAEMLRVEADRHLHRSIPFAPDNEWQREFEDAFLFEETPDQAKAITETKRDMESPRPMDRLICGDVGFGKTEVAIRAAFKAVMSGRQVALLAPTTVLAQQHANTFRERMADYPIRVDLLSRFRTPKQQRITLKAAREGKVDILVGTHRLLQPDIAFKNLGLVIVDEEQRFGVKHKERFKQIFKTVDVLTLSATPIPRTLYLTLMGARDMSPIETPPPNRLPVETFVGGYDERLIRSAIERELDRGGQVFFLHNRVHSIHGVRDRLRLLLPKARLEIAHGQMEEHELEEVMMRFVAGEVDVLVATTIIESGLDIPRANTIIIDRADRFGLADLYQLRGRVGRSQMKAYAYLLLPRHLMIEEQARRRVSAIRQYSALGSGFKVAMRDLEIRGAGNVLGTEQSGHASAIGFELYCRLLKESIARLKGEKPAPRVEARVRLDFLPMSEDHAADGVGAFLPRAFMGESRQRIEAYRHLAEASDEAELRQLESDWRDRFGRLPAPVTHLLELAHLRLAAAARGIARVEVEEGNLMLEKGGHLIMVDGRFPRLTPPAPPRAPVHAKRRPATRREWLATQHPWLAEIRHLIETLGIPTPKSEPRSP